MALISCIIPNAPQYESYDINEKKIKIKADEIEDASNKNYKFTYIIEDEEKIIESSQNIVDIDCEKGKKISIYYSYSTSNMASENSSKNSFYCATVPSNIGDNNIKYFTSTENKVFLSWNPPPDDGGSPIQKYLIKYKKKNSGTSSEPSDEYTEINCLETSIIVNENIEAGNTYEFYIYPINYIVSSIKPEFLENINNAAKKEIEVKKLADSKNCKLSGSGLENFSSTTPSVEIKLEAYNTDNEKMTSVDGIFMLQVQDYCILKNENNKFICERQTSETTQNIFESEEDYIIKTFEKISDSPGDYNAEYSIFGNGKITIFVYQLIKGGLLGQYYDNVWFLEPFINEKVDYKIDFKWEENANIINNLNDFISIRWIGALLSPETNLFTFSISSDDGIRIYLNNKNVFDHLNSPCDACYFEYNMKENKFYWIKIDFVQLQGPSRIKLFWQTSSRAKEIIPSEFLFFPEIMKDIPKTLEISNENIHPAKCYVEKHDKIVFVGKVSKINIIPVNSNDEKITINNDNAINFDISIINKDQNNKNGNLYFQSKLNNTDTSSPYFYAEFIPLIPGEYIVEIKFGTTSIKNSPYNIIVKHGEVSPIYSIIDNKDAIPSTKAGLITKIKLNLYDVMNNKYNSEPDYFPINIKFIALWISRESNVNECSTRGILDENSLSEKYAGNAKSNSDGTYELTISPLKSGKYELSIYINEQLIKDCPFELNIEPSILDATKCISNNDHFSLTAGDNFEIYYQCKDTYGNNINNNDITPEAEEINLMLNGNSEIKINGQYDTNTGQFGCYLFKFENIEKAGTYKTKILIKGLLIPQIDVEVLPSTPSHEKSNVEILNDKSKYFVGDNIQLKMICLDKYENLIKEENKCIFTIKNEENIISEDNSLKYEGNGIYIFSKQFTTAGTYSFNVFLNLGEPSTEYEIKNSPIKDVILYPGMPREKSIIKINENETPTPTSNPTIQSFRAGETITSMKALLKDEYGNIIEEQGNEKIYLDFMDKNNISNIFTFEGKYMKTSDNYNYHFHNVLLMKATEYSISLKIIDNFGLIGYYYQSADFYNLLDKQDRNYHKSLNNIDKSYTRIDPEINFSPIYLSFTDDLPFELISIEWKGYLKSNTSEMYTIYLDIFGKALLYLDNELVINYVESNNGNENSVEKYTPNFVNVYLKRDELIPIKLIYIKNKDEILSKIIMSWESDSIQKQVIPQSNLYSDIYSEDEQSIKIEIAKTNIESLEIINENTLSNYLLDNDNKYSFKFKLYDIFGNEINENRIDIDILIKVYLIKTKDQSVLNCDDVNFDSTNGVYVYAATCKVADEGNYNLEIEISYKNEGTNKLYNNFELFTCSKNSDLNLCSKKIIEGDGLTKSIAGVESSFTLTFIDDEVSKNIIYSCANVVLLSATIISTNSGSDKIPVSVVYDSSIDSKNYGKFIFSYTGYKASDYKIQISINNIIIEDEYIMNLSPGEPSNEISQYIQTDSKIIEMGKNFDFEINLYDSYLNLVDNNNYKINSEIRGKFGIYKNILTKESDSSLYKASFIINRVNNTFSGCGIGTLSSFILKKGMRINYFDNYFVNGNPFISEIKKEGKIELDLGTDDLLGNLYDKLYTSIQYMFYFQPETDSIYHFLIYSNGNNIRLYFDDELVIDSFNKPLLNQYSFTTSVNLNKVYVYSFRLNIYIRETTVKFFINYYTDDNSELKLMDITNNNIFYSDKNPIGNKKNNINFYSKPGKIEKIYQDLDTKDKIKIKWEKPNDDGCNEIKKYKIHLIDPIKDFIYELNNDDLSYDLPNADATDLTIEQNKEYQFQISAINTINGNDLESDPSDIIICKLTSYTISNFQVAKSTENENDIIIISWDEITIITIPNEQINYHLEYCISDTFDNFIEIYSGSNPKYEMNAKSNNLKYGQEYKFKVYAETGMNKGEYSEIKTFYYSGKPEKPPSPPKIDMEKTTKDHLEFTFEPIIQNNGEPIKKYILSINININENEETNEIPVTVTNSNIYRYIYEPVNSNKYIPIIVRYLAENDNGRGPFSDPSLPMYAATKPDKPNGLLKDLTSTQKGIIKIEWVEPTSDGGAPILGYKIYLNDIYITSVQSNINKYSFQNIFDINDKNKIAVSAYNIMGESEKYEIKDVDSTTVPGKINAIKLKSYSSSSLTVIWEEPSDNGGLSQLSYGIRINDGSEIGKNFRDEEKEISILEKIFEGLNPSKYYTIQVRAYNSNGAGEWSDYITFFTGGSPGVVQNFKWEKDLSDKSKIVLTWEPPSDDGGCDIYGYKIFNEGEVPLYNGKDLFFIFDYKFNIIPSNYYYFEIYAYNCAYESNQKTSVYAYSAKVPEKMNPITFKKYDPSEKSLSISYDNSFYDGGLPIKYLHISISCTNCDNDFNKENEISDFKSNEIIIKDDSFEQGKIYKIQIWAENEIGNGEKSDEKEIILDDIPQFPENFDFKISCENDKFNVNWEIIPGSKDNPIGYRIYLSENYIENNQLNNYTLIYDTFRKGAITYYVLNSSKLNLIESKLYHIYLTAYNFAGETEPVYTNFYYGKLPPTPYALRLYDIIKNEEDDKYKITLGFKLNISKSILPIKKYYIKNNKNTQKEISNIRYDQNNLDIILIDDEETEIIIGELDTYYIKAVNDVGEGEWSYPLEVIYSVHPNKPGGFSIKKRLNKTSLIITWEEDEKIENNDETLGYAIYLNSFLLYDSAITTNSNEYTLTDLIPGKIYKITIKSVNKLGESLGLEDEFTAGLVPTKVLNVRRQSYSKDSVKIIFDPPEDDGGSPITSYKCIKIIKGEEIQKKSFNPSEILSVTFKLSDGDLENDRATFYINATNVIGDGPEEKDIYIFYKGSVPKKPKELKVNKIIPIENEEGEFNLCNAYIKWNAPEDNGSPIYKYQILIMNNSNNEYELLNDEISPSLINNYLIKNLIIGTEYKLQISAFNLIGQGELYYKSFSTVYNPSPPLNLTIISQENGKIELSWIKPLFINGEMITNYYITYQKDSSGNNEIETNSINTVYTLTGLDINHEYKIYIKAKNEKYKSESSNIVYGYAINPPDIDDDELTPKIEVITPNSIKISWTDGQKLNEVEDIEIPPLIGYEVYIRDIDESFDYKLIYEGKYIDNAFETIVDGLINGHNYGVVYYAYSKVGKSNRSKEGQILCATPPSSPEGLVLESVTESEIEISWYYSDTMNSNLVPLTGFYIYNGEEKIKEDDSELIPANYNSLKINAVVNNIYKLGIKAVNSVGESKMSDNILTVKAGKIPNKPTMTLKSFDSNYCELSFKSNDNSDQREFILYLKNENKNDLSIIYEGSSSSYKHENLIPFTKYTYTLSVKNEIGESPKSSLTECTIYPLSSAPGKIYLIRSDYTSIELKWSPPSEVYNQINKYKLYMRSDEGGIFTNIKSENILTYEVKVNQDGIEASKQYEFYVTAVDIYNRESPKTNVVKYYCASVPNKVSNINIDEKIKPNKMKLSWTYNPYSETNSENQLPNLYYKVYYKDESIQNSNYEFIKIADNINNYYILDNLLYGHTYSFYVSAVNQVGEGEKSDPPIKGKLIYSPDPPDIFYIKDVNLDADNMNCIVTFAWQHTKNINNEENKSITKYKIQAFQLDESEQRIESTQKNKEVTDINFPNLMTCDIDGLEKDKNYEIIIKSCINDEIEVESVEVKITKKIMLKPTKIENIIINDNSRSRTSLGITWDKNDNENIYYYLIYILSNKEGDTLDQNDYIISYKNEYLFTNLEKGENLKIQIEAVNEIGAGPKSDIISIPIYGLPDSPTNIYISSKTKTDITINFSPTNEDGGSPITKYILYRSTNSFFINREQINEFVITDNNINILTFKDENVSPCNLYYYTVTSMNELDESEVNQNSIISAFTQIAPSTYSADLTITKIGNNSFYVNWKEIDEENNGGCKNDITYILYMKAVEQNSEFSKIYSGNNRYYKVENLDLWKKYKFKLVVANSINSVEIEEKESNELTGYILSPPKNLRLIERKITKSADPDPLTTISVKIMWDIIENDSSFSNYKIYYSNSLYSNNDNNELISEISQNEFELKNPDYSDLKEGEYIYFYISTINLVGEGPKSRPLKVLVGEIPLAPQTKLEYLNNPKSKSITLQIPSLEDLGDIYGNINPSRYIIKMNDKIAINSTSSINTINNLKLGSTYTFTYALSNIIYEENNLLNESLNFGGETKVELKPILEQVQNLRFGQNKNKLYADKVKLEWDPLIITNEPLFLNFIIYQSCQSCTTNTDPIPIDADASSSSKIIEGLIPGNKYSFYITGKYEGNYESPKSNIIVFTSGLKPSKPETPTLVELTTSSIKIKLKTSLSDIGTGGITDHPLDIKKFIIYKNGNKYAEINKDTQGYSEYSFNNLIKGEEYYIQISCINIIGESELSDELFVTPSYHPSAPLNLRIVSQSSSEIKLSWDEPLDTGGLPIISYEINIKEKSVLNEPESQETVQDTSFSFSKTDGKGKEYIFKVRSINKYSIDKESESDKFKWSEEVTGYLISIPSSVQGLTINDDYDKYHGELAWTPLSNDAEKGYSNNIKYILNVKYDNNQKDIDDIVIGSNNYNFKVPILGMKYYFKIIAKNEVGYSESNEIEIIFRSKPKQMKPLVLESMSVFTDPPYIQLSWADDITNENIKNELQYYIISMKKKDDNDADIKTIYEENNINNKNIIINQNKEDSSNSIITPGEIYYFYISAKSDRGLSERSEGLEVIFVEAPQSINSVEKTVNADHIEIKWKIDNILDGGNDISGFIIQNKLSINSNYKNLNLTISSTTDLESHTIAKDSDNYFSIEFPSDDLQKGSYYNFRIAAYNKYVNNLDLLNFNEPLSILFASVPSQITTFAQNFDNLKPNQVNLSWEPPGGNGGSKILNYIITKIITNENNEVSYELLSLSSDINYYEDNDVENDNIQYTIRSVNAAGESVESVKITCHPGLKPGKVLNLKTASVQQNEIVIQFNKPENANQLNCPITEFKIFYKIGDNNELSGAPTYDSENDIYKFELSMSLGGTSYYSEGTQIAFKVYGVNSVGDGEIEELTTYNCNNPQEPEFSIYERRETGIDFYFKPNNADLEKMKNNNNCKLTKFQLYRDDEIACEGTSRIVKCSIDNLENGSSFDFKLIYYNNVGGESEPKIKNYIIGVLPNDIDNLKIDRIEIAVNEGKMDISWDRDTSNSNNLGIKYYVLYAKEGEEYPTNNLESYMTENNNKNLPGLEKGRKYKVKVYAKNDIGSGKESELEQIVDNPPEMTETDVTFSDITCNSFKIKWEKVSSTYPIQYYNIYKNGELYHKFTIESNDNQESYEYSIENLEKLISYQIGIAAENEVGESNKIIKSVKTCITNANIITSFNIIKKEGENNDYIIRWNYDQDQNDQNKCYCNIAKSFISIFKNEITDSDGNIYNGVKNKEIFINEYEFNLDNASNEITKLIFKIIIYDENGMTAEKEYELGISSSSGSGSITIQI